MPGLIKVARLSGVLYVVNLNSGPKESGSIKRGSIKVARLTGGSIKWGPLYQFNYDLINNVYIGSEFSYCIYCLKNLVCKM